MEYEESITKTRWVFPPGPKTRRAQAEVRFRHSNDDGRDHQRSEQQKQELLDPHPPPAA